jgi:hypothetical protein
MMLPIAMNDDPVAAAAPITPPRIKDSISCMQASTIRFAGQSSSSASPSPSPPSSSPSPSSSSSLSYDHGRHDPDQSSPLMMIDVSSQQLIIPRGHGR